MAETKKPIRFTEEQLEPYDRLYRFVLRIIVGVISIFFYVVLLYQAVMDPTWVKALIVGPTLAWTIRRLVIIATPEVGTSTTDKVLETVTHRLGIPEKGDDEQTG